MRIAVLHNFLDNIGGSEKVALILARELNADLYTTNIDQEKIDRMGFSDVTVKSIGRVPTNAPFRHQATLSLFRKLDLGDQYDFFIIAGDWAFSAAVNNKPSLWYVHAPSREIWDLYLHIRNTMVSPLLRPVYDVWVKYNRFLTIKYLPHVGTLVCNSKNTQARIKRFFKKDVQVVNPPHDTKDFVYKGNGDFWLAVNRLFHHKQVEVQLEAFRQMPDENLVIVGSYEQSRHFKEYANKIKKLKPENVTLMHWVSDSELKELYSTCKGFITTPLDEDFGMTAVEAMAAGKPVIAPAAGGYRETVVDRETGSLLDKTDTSALISAIKEVGANPEQYKDACQRRAAQFDTKVFIEKIRSLIND